MTPPWLLSGLLLLGNVEFGQDSDEKSTLSNKDMLEAAEAHAGVFV